MQVTQYARSNCPIAASLDLLGDKWSLIIIRDMIQEKSKFKEFLESPENITTNILADRLKKLEVQGLIFSQAYQHNPVRYAYFLTEKGRALHPILQDLCRWGNAYLPHTWIPPESFMQES